MNKISFIFSEKELRQATKLLQEKYGFQEPGSEKYSESVLRKYKKSYETRLKELMNSGNVEVSMREDEIKREKIRTDKGSVKLYSEFLNKLLTQGDPLLEKKRIAYLRKLHKEIKPKVY